MICFRVSAGISKLTGSSPSAITGKSSRGSVPSEKRARPATIVMRPSAAVSATCEPSGSFRAMSKRVCAETVVAPGWSTAAATLSLIWRSRSVAIIRSAPSAVASSSTLDRIGMVLRRSTTDWTWLSPLRSVARSIVAFMSFPPAHRTRTRGKPRRGVLAKEKGAGQAPHPSFRRSGPA